jgi:hypothetical protein
MTDDNLNPEIRSRLKAELDRVQPLHSSPRYLAKNQPPLTWRFAPAVLVASVISILALSAFVATGSPNPADWGHDVVTIIQSSSTTPTPTPKPTPTLRPTPSHTQEPDEHESPEPREHESPEPPDDHSGEGSGSGDGGQDGDGGLDDEEHEGSSSDSD